MTIPAQYTPPPPESLRPAHNVTPSSLSAQMIEGPEVLLESLTDEWNALVGTPPLNEPFLYPYWFRAFAKTFNRGRPISLITVRDDRRLVGVLPLQRQRTFFGRIPAGTFSSLAGIHSCRFDLICAPSAREAVSEAIWKRLKNRDDWDVVEAMFVPTDGAFTNLLRSAERDGYLTAIWPTQRSPFLTLPSRGSPPLQNCPPRYADSRKRLKRYERRLRDHGEPVFEAISTFSEQLFEEFMDLEASGWKGETGSAIKCSPTTTEFYREVLREASKLDQFRMCTLSVSGRKIAMEMALVAEGVCFSPKVAYDESFSNTSPGALLVQRIITDLVHNGYGRYDLLGFQARHKAIWAGEERQHANFYIFRPTILGRLRHALIDSIGPRVKALKYRWYGDPQSLDPHPSKHGRNRASGASQTSPRSSSTSILPQGPGTV